MNRFLLAAALILSCLRVSAQEAEKLVGEGVTLHPLAVTEAPVIDGRLDDAAWSGKPLVDGYFITNNPVYGLESDQKTRVWMAYDPHNIYLAFYCHDTDPGKIKASITRRDNLFGDDWVGVDIDTLGTRQTVHEIICNPLGMQADLINTATGGESTDPDWVWYSAGRVVEDGYIVEMKLPVKSFKFRNAESIAINVAFYRFNQPHRHQLLLAPDQPGEGVFQLPYPRHPDRPEPATAPGNPAFLHLRQHLGPAEPANMVRGRRLGPVGHRHQIRHHFFPGRRDHHQSRLQPGGKRPVPGGGQPALPSVLQ